MSDKAPTGWERENRTIFDDVVFSFDRLRWDYPDKLYEDIFDYIREGNSKTAKPHYEALEIGAGTGKSTAPVLAAGYNVTAVELGEKMAEFLKDRFKDNKNLSVINAAFEEAELPDDRYDLVYAASSFHWVDAAIGCPKVYRILKNGGVFALFRNNSIPSEVGELFSEIQAVYEKHYYSHYTENKRPSKKAKEEYLKPEQILIGWGFDGMEQYGFGDTTIKLYEGSRVYSSDEYIELIDTYSDHRALPDSNRAALYAGVKDAINKHGGYHKLDFIYQLYMGRKG